MRLSLALLLLGAAVLLGAGCGQKGDLYLPDKPASLAAIDTYR